MELVNAIFGAIGTVTLGLEQSELFVNKIIFSYEHLNKLSGNTVQGLGYPANSFTPYSLLIVPGRKLR